MSDPFKDIAEQQAGDPPPEWLFWDKEIRLSLKREKRFREQAKKVLELYEAEKESDNNFNILYANTETLLPACYNQVPRPMVERRFKDSDPIGKQVSTVLERTLTYLMDSPDAEYEKYDDLFKQATLGALVPGRGVTWWVYDPKIEGAADAVGDREEEPRDERGLAAEEPVSGKVVPSSGEKVVWETVCGEVVEYDKFLMGYAKRWKNVPWIARQHAMTREDAEENFGEVVAKTLEYLEDAREGEKADHSAGDEGADERRNQGSSKTAVVYEIWHKSKKQLLFFAPSRKDGLCEEPIDDPYGLTGFYPVEEPLQFLKKMTTVVPTPIYRAYEPQAKELNRISLRINRILNAMKVRGFYDGSVQGLSELLQKDDNTLIAAKNVVAMKEGAGANLANSIWFMPLDMLVSTVKELYLAREQTKQVIYEITGIADIMRGSTQAQETATAQNIKDKWGGLRLQNMQGAVQGYIRGCLRIVAELSGKHFDLATFVGMTNLDYATPEQLQQAQATLQAITAVASQMQQPSPDPSAPPAAPQLPPQMQQAAQEAQAVMAKPQWQPVVDVLRDNIQRGYKVDIETNSTLANTSAEDQENVTKALTALGAILQQFIPAVQIGMMTMPAVKEIMLSTARRFEFGRQVETALEGMPDQLPQAGVSPEMQKAQEELAKREEKVKGDEQAVQEGQMEIESKSKEVANDIKTAKDELKMATEAALHKQEMAQEKFLMAVERANMKGEMQRDKQLNKAAMQQHAHEQKVDLRLSAHEQQVEQTAAKAKMDQQAAAAKNKAVAK